VTTAVLAYLPSPSQGVWHLGPVPIRAYALFIIVGIFVALVIGDRRWVARGGEQGVIYDIAIPAVLFGLLGGRLYHVMTDWRTYFGEDGAGLAGALRIWDGGLGIWGAVALGGVGAWIGCRYKGIPLPAFGDAIAPGIVLAQAIGRLGNYFNQELYGRPTTLPWGLEVYQRRNASGAIDTLNGVSTGQPLIPGVEAVHPTFLYELLWNLLVFAALIYIDRRFKIGHGRLFAMYVAGYCLGRFWIELMRSDVATQIAGIRINTFTSVFVFIGAVVYIMVAPKGREDPATLRGKPAEAEEEEDTSVEEFVKELTAVAATTGVVAAARAAGEAEDEDAKVAAEDMQPDELEEAGEAEAETDGTGAATEDAASEAEEPEGEEIDEPAAEAEIDEAEEPEAEEGEEAEAEVELEAETEEAEEPEAEEPAAEVETGEAEEAEEPEPEAEVDAETEEAEEAEEPTAEPEQTEESETDEAEEPEAEAAAEQTEPEAEEGEEAQEPVAEAESEEAEEAEEPAAEAEEPESEAAEEPEPEADEPETEDAEAAVEAAGSKPSEEEAAEEAEAVVEEADAAADDEPETGVLEAAAEPAPPSDESAPDEESGGRLRRWLRGRRSR
jgi:phosphatidylglycerol---prolipoprotein diacylglyceryl transferase